jgi:TolB-like protein/Tfp pilus assembly protein PilF
MSSPSSNTNDGLPKRAVFLSYAREDSAAAQRITDALRSQGIEVWFDQSELRGGDVWDQKIRRQIKDCALFMPVISGRTQERGEGYFRLEWKLAVERTHLMAEGVPFLCPVVVDTTVESAALVPAEFLRVQWTRLPSALPTPQFVEQVQRMLEKPGQAVPAAFRATSFTQEIKPRSSLPLIVGAVVALVVAVGATFIIMRRPPPASAQTVAPVAAPAAPTIDPKSIAVLPFANMSEDKDNEFFTDGMHEDVLTNLSFIKDLHVVSRTSVMQYRTTTKSIKTIAQELGVAYILEGSVRREGNKVRVTGQLIDARTDEHVWAKAYDRDLNDIFAIQGELSQAIADALQSVLDPQTKVLLARRPTENTEAYDDYLKARELKDRNELGAQTKVAELLEDSVRLDPNFAQAWAVLASQTAFINFGAVNDPQVAARAKEAIDNAVRLAPDDPTVIEGLGDYFYYTARDYIRSTEQYMRLEQIRPNDAAVYFSLGLIQRRQGRWAEALVNMKKGLELDPTSHEYQANYYDTLVNLRRYDEAELLLRKKMAERPHELELEWGYAVLSFYRSGSTEQAKAFAAMSFPKADSSLVLYTKKAVASISLDLQELIRLDQKQRYFDGNPEDPRYAQDLNFAYDLADGGDLKTAQARATEALEIIRPMLATNPGNVVLWLGSAMGNGLLGHRAETLAGIEKVKELLPESRDALTGAQYAAAYSLALAYCGEKEKSLAEVERLLQTPYGLNMYAARMSYRPLWDMPRFKELVNDPKNNAPLL